MKIRLFFECLTNYFDTVRFLKSNNVNYNENEDDSIIIGLDRKLLEKINYSFARVL